MKKARERRRQATDFRKAVYCPFAVFQGSAWRKNGFRRVPRVTGTLGKVNSHFNQPKQGREPHHHVDHVEAAVNWCSCERSRFNCFQVIDIPGSRSPVS